jgi:hypothetical protein
MTDDLLDSDTYVRLRCLDAIDSMAERAASVGVFLYTDASDLAHGVNVLCHAITSGKDVGFDCQDSARKFVRGE